jgi:hypothetical protein
MARIARKFQKIFASSATNNGVFGSGADNTKVLSNDVETLQSKAAFLTGWLDAVIGTKKFPPLEEFQSLNYINTSQLAYIFQEGVPEYNALTTYYTNCIVKETGTYKLYGSVTNANVGNALSNATYWQLLVDLGAGTTLPVASESTQGIIQIATAAETNTGTNDTKAITPLKLASHWVPTGAVMNYAFSTAPAGYVFASSQTIGDGSSGATNRANADTLALFTGLWNDYSNTDLPIQNSSGVPTSRGANAAADFALHKRLPTLDARGRVLAGLDNMGGVTAGRLTGQSGGVNGNLLGATGGFETHSLIEAQNATHSHQPQVNNGSGSSITVVGSTATFGTTASQAIYPLTATSGSGSPHNNVQPTIVLPVIMKL